MSPQPPNSSDPLPTLSLGDSGEAVSELRQLLAKSDRNFGLPGIPVGDVFDTQLEAIIRIFQYQVFLFQDGIVSDKTWRALHADAPVHMPSVQLGSNNMAVRQAQRRLRQHNEYEIALDGNFDQAMHEVVVTFQTHQGLTSDGQIGPATWLCLSQR